MSIILEKVMKRVEKDNRTIENGLYHIHVPKTAGTFLANMMKNEKRFIHGGHRFGREDIEHYGHIPQYNNNWKYWPTYIYEPGFRKSVRFSIVRSPISWLKSYYSHNYKLNNPIHTGWASVRDYHGFESFEEFAEAFMDLKYKFHLDVLRKFQLAQCFDVNDKCRSDFLVYNENIEIFLDTMEEKYSFKLNRDLEKKINTSKSSQVEISENLKKKLLLYFSPHMSLFGYDEYGNIDKNRAILDTDGVFVDPYNLKFSANSGKIYLK